MRSGACLREREKLLELLFVEEIAQNVESQYNATNE